MQRLRGVGFVFDQFHGRYDAEHCDDDRKAPVDLRYSVIIAHISDSGAQIHQGAQPERKITDELVPLHARHGLLVGRLLINGLLIGRLSLLISRPGLLIGRLGLLISRRFLPLRLLRLLNDLLTAPAGAAESRTVRDLCSAILTKHCFISFHQEGMNDAAFPACRSGENT